MEDCLLRQAKGICKSAQRTQLMAARLTQKTAENNVLRSHQTALATCHLQHHQQADGPGNVQKPAITGILRSAVHSCVRSYDHGNC
jgi:hypothetical protein